MATPKELAKFYASAPSEDAVCEVSCQISSDGWRSNGFGPRLPSRISDYRWKPQAKVIDMTHLVGSDVLCEFWDSEKFLTLGTLRSIDSGGRYITHNGVAGWRYCRPVFNRWQVPTADTQPIPDGFMVEVVLRRGTIEAAEPKFFSWATDRGECDIIHYRVVGIAEGWVTHE